MHVRNCSCIYTVACPVGTEYRDCSWNLSCSHIIGVGRCREQSLCTSGCFCSNQTVLVDGMCSDTNSCSGTYVNNPMLYSIIGMFT